MDSLFNSPSTRGSIPCLVAHVDGGARGNPGPAGFGVVLHDQAGQKIAELSEYLGKQTNNFAEYSGLLAALNYALQHGHPGLKVFSDSELMVKQINGQFKVSNPVLKELHGKAQALIRQLQSFSITHVLREKNREADRLANLAMDRGMPRSERTVPAREVRGVVQNGVVEFVGDALPDGTPVLIRPIKQLR